MNKIITLLSFVGILALAGCASTPPQPGRDATWLGNYLDANLIEVVQAKGAVRITTRQQVLLHGRPVTSFALWHGESFVIPNPRYNTRLTLRSVNSTGIVLDYVSVHHTHTLADGEYEMASDSGTITVPWQKAY